MINLENRTAQTTATVILIEPVTNMGPVQILVYCIVIEMGSVQQDVIEIIGEKPVTSSVNVVMGSFVIRYLGIAFHVLTESGEKIAKKTATVRIDGHVMREMDTA